MSNRILINVENLNRWVADLSSVAEDFTSENLTTESRSTLSVIKNSIESHQSMTGVHLQFASYLTKSANMISDIGERFFDIDIAAAGMMGIAEN